MKMEDAKTLKYDEISTPRYVQTAKLINKTQGNLLDIGARTSILKNHISKEIEYFAVDIDEDSITKLQLKGINAKVASVENLPFDNNFFDIVVLGEVMEHLPNPGLSLTEVKRVLKKEGILIISVPNSEFKRRVYRAFMNLPKLLFKKKKLIKTHNLGGHLYMFTKAHMDLLLKTAGFNVKEWVISIFNKSLILRAKKTGFDH